MKRPDDEQIAQWYPRLFRTALRLTGCAEDAADLTQQTFCKAIEKWHQFGDHSLPTTWLHQILVNCVRDWARRKAIRKMQTFSEWELVPAGNGRGAAMSELHKNEQLACLRQAVEAMSEKLRIAFVATVMDGYSYQEASEILDVPVGTIASRVNAARQELSGVMRSAFGEA